MKFLRTYRKVKDKFIKPRIRWYFGPWRREGNLPVWRRGNMIRFAKYGEYDSKWHYAKMEDSWWTELGKKNHPILSKIFKPEYQLPLWLSFYFFNSDIMYKTKWEDDDYRYEYPAHITLVFFGFAISITALAPKISDSRRYDDEYWESILTYIHYDGDLEKTNNTMGYFTVYGETPKIYHPRFVADFLKNEEERNRLKEIQKEYLKKIEKKEVEFLA